MKLGIVFDKIQESKYLEKEARKVFEDVYIFSIRDIKFEVGNKIEVSANGLNLFNLDYLLVFPSWRNKDIFYALLRIVSERVKTNLHPSSYLMFLNQPKVLRSLKERKIKVKREIFLSNKPDFSVLKKKIKFPVFVSFSGRSIKVDSLSALKTIFSTIPDVSLVGIYPSVTAEKIFWSFYVNGKIFTYEINSNSTVSGHVDDLVKKIKEIFGFEIFGVKLLKVGKDILVDKIVLTPNLRKLEVIFGRSFFRELFRGIRKKLEIPSPKDILYNLLGRIRP